MKLYPVYDLRGMRCGGVGFTPGDVDIRIPVCDDVPLLAMLADKVPEPEVEVVTLRPARLKADPSKAVWKAGRRDISLLIRHHKLIPIATVHDVPYVLQPTISQNAIYHGILYPTIETPRGIISVAKGMLSRESHIGSVMVDGEAEWRQYYWRQRESGSR